MSDRTYPARPSAAGLPARPISQQHRPLAHPLGTAPCRAACIAWGGALACLIAALLLRATSFLPSVINPDESLYAVQAQAWLRGAWPYVAVWDMHPVGAPALVAGAFALFGESISTLRLLGTLAVAANGVALAWLVRRLGGGRLTGLAAGLLAVAGATLLDGLATNTEILLAPFVTLGLGATLLGRAGWAGLLLGLALLVKPVVLPQAGLALALLLAAAPPRQRWAALWRFGLGAGAPAAGVALLYALRGDFAALLEGAVLAPLRYLAMGAGAAQAARVVLASLASLGWPLLLAAALLPRRAQPRPGELSLGRLGLAWFAAASLAVALPGMYFQHYFLLWVSPVALLAALGARRLARLARPGAARLVFAGLVLAVMLETWAAVLLPRFEKGIGLREPDPPQVVAQLLQQQLAPGESLFVVNWQPLLYFLTGTAPPTRYALPAQLTGPYAGIIGADPDAELARILAGQPRILVVDRGHFTAMRAPAQAQVTAALAGYRLLASIPAGHHSVVELWRRR